MWVQTASNFALNFKNKKNYFKILLYLLLYIIMSYVRPRKKISTQPVEFRNFVTAKPQTVRPNILPVRSEITNQRIEQIDDNINNADDVLNTPLTKFSLMTRPERKNILNIFESQSKKNNLTARNLLPKFKQVDQTIRDQKSDYLRRLKSLFQQIQFDSNNVKNKDKMVDLKSIWVSIIENSENGLSNTINYEKFNSLLNFVETEAILTNISITINQYPAVKSYKSLRDIIAFKVSTFQQRSDQIELNKLNKQSQRIDDNVSAQEIVIKRQQQAQDIKDAQDKADEAKEKARVEEIDRLQKAKKKIVADKVQEKSDLKDLMDDAEKDRATESTRLSQKEKDDDAKKRQAIIDKAQGVKDKKDQRIKEKADALARIEAAKTQDELDEAAKIKRDGEKREEIKKIKNVVYTDEALKFVNDMNLISDQSILYNDSKVKEYIPVKAKPFNKTKSTTELDENLEALKSWVKLKKPAKGQNLSYTTDNLIQIRLIANSFKDICKMDIRQQLVLYLINKNEIYTTLNDVDIKLRSQQGREPELQTFIDGTTQEIREAYARIILKRVDLKNYQFKVSESKRIQEGKGRGKGINKNEYRPINTINRRIRYY
jgi:hypothetical protein